MCINNRLRKNDNTHRNNGNDTAQRPQRRSLATEMPHLNNREMWHFNY